jgi:hypothetical protein
MIQRLIVSASERLGRASLTFGLREAVIVSVTGVAIASAVAYHFAG